MIQRSTAGWVGAALLACVLSPVVSGTLRGESRFPAALLCLAVALACVLTRQRHFRDSARRFWQLIGGALVAWMLFELVAFVLPEHGFAACAAAAFCMAVVFVGLVLALDCHPHFAAPTELARPRMLERVGAVVFPFGLLLYVVPDDGFELGLRCLLLLFVLYLAARLAHWSAACPPGGWRSAYRALWLGAFVIACSLAGPLVFAGRWAAFWTSLSLLAPLAIVSAVLLAGGAKAPELDEELADLERPGPPELLGQLWSGPLTAYAVAFPAFHLAGYAINALDPGLRGDRDVVALVLLFALGGLALLHQKQLERRTDDVTMRFRRVSLFDPLTGLPNRTSFLERVSRSLERSRRVTGYQFAVLAVELDRYKLIENAYGPRFAQEIVVGLAARLKKCLRPGDMVASLSPDRFAVLADHIRPAHAVHDLGEIAQRIGGTVMGAGFAPLAELGQGGLAAEIAERILRDVVAPPIAVHAREVYPRGSIGIATSDPGYLESDEMLRDAQAAARRAKLRGSGTFEIFDPDMQAESLARLVIESELHHAVARGELLLQYQPVVRLDGGQIEGFEALLRWHHPTRGLLRPAEFLSAADTAGLMSVITSWVIGESCLRAAEWQRLLGRPLFVSCNIGSPQFKTHSLRAVVGEALAAAGLAGEHLKLEITEGVAIAGFDAVRAEIEDLKQLGVDFLLDDFGTGYSSLSYLHRLPVKGIKIDRSFVENLPHDVGATALVRGIVELARELQRDVIAEGIETQEQWDSVRGLGCGYGQGYRFGRPAGAADVAAQLGVQRAQKA